MRVVLALLLGAGVAGLALLPQPGSFLIAMAAMAVGFLLAAAKAAVDLIELSPAEIAADAIALVRIPAGDTTLTAILFLVGAAAQVLPRGLATHIR